MTVKQEMRPTSQPIRGPHHTGMSGPLPMESPAHLDRNTHSPRQIPDLALLNWTHTGACAVYSYLFDRGIGPLP